MSHNFLPCDRDQELLLPPSLAEWLPEDHLAWFVIDAVEEIDLDPFYAAYRSDGWGRAAFDPKAMVCLLLYAYCVGERSSRGIERRCREDVAFRVICANQTPDHATIARFRARHERALAETFTEVLRLCAEAGLVSVGLLALDGTKVKADASRHETRSYEQIGEQVERILAEAAALDAEEDERLGPRRGDELPDELQSRRGRRARLQECKQRLEAAHAERQGAYEARLAARAAIEAQMGKRLRGRKPKPPADLRSAQANTTDPDSRIIKTAAGFVQGYNAQAVATESQVIVCAEIAREPTDQAQLVPMVEATKRSLAAVGMQGEMETVVADAGYWSAAAIERIADDGLEVLVATRTDSIEKRAAQRRRGAGPTGVANRTKVRAEMEAALGSNGVTTSRCSTSSATMRLASGMPRARCARWTRPWASPATP